MGDTDNSLVSFNGLSEVANKLIDKISSAVGWVVTHDTPKKIAVKSYIENIKNSDYPPLEKAALISNAKKIIKEYSNQSNIVKIAIQNMKQEAKPESVDDTWLNEFMDKSKNISGEQLQFIWGKILAEEVNEPGSFSIRTLDILRGMKKAEAECFMKMAALVVKSGYEYIVLNNEVSKERFSFEDILNLCECGIFTTSSELSGTTKVMPNDKQIIFFNRDYILIGKNTTAEMQRLTYTFYKFSKNAGELLNLITPEVDNKVLFKSAQTFQKSQNNIIFNIYKVIRINGNRSVEYDGSKPIDFNLLSKTL